MEHECIAVGYSGNECRMPARYEFVGDGEHVVYACETHRDAVLRDMADYNVAFTYRVLD